MADKSNKHFKAWCISAIAIATMACTLFASGCIRKIQVIDNNNVVTNSVSATAFQDESYVWESWFFSTNKVEK